MDIVTLGAALNGSAEYVNSHFVGGSNIQIVDNPDGTQTINASGEVSSEDTVARAEIAEMKDGTTLDSFGDVETALTTKADSSTTYTKTEVDTALSVKANSADVYTKTAVDTALGNKADKSTTYTKTEVDTALSAKADKTTTYTKTEVDTALDDKVDKETGKGLSTNDYTTTEKTKLAGIAEGAEVNEIEGIKVNGSTVNPDANKVVNITVPTSAADVSALPNTTKYAAALSLTINSLTYVMTGQLKDQNGDNLGTAQTIDLPLESVVVNGSYNSQTKKVVLTLQNGNTIEFSVADLVSGLQTELSSSNKLNPAYIDYDSAHAAVTEAQRDQISTNQTNIGKVQTQANWNTNNGVKNLSQYNNATENSPLVIPVNFKSGESYIVSWDSITSTSSAGSSRIAFMSGESVGSNIYYASHGVAGSTTLTLTADCNSLWVYAGSTYEGNKTVTISNFMVRPATIADSTYEPYALPNTKITPELVELVDSGAKNELKVTKDTIAALNSGTWSGNVFTPAGQTGFTLTINSDGSISTSGAPSAGVYIALSTSLNTILTVGKTYVLSGCTGGSSATYGIYSGTQGEWDNFDGGTEKVYASSITSVCLYVRASASVTGKTFKPMICTKSAWDVSQKYVPYRPTYEETVEQVAENKNNISSIQQEQIVQNADIATLRLALDTKIYGIRIDKQDVNPDTRVTYLYDAVGMTPAYMDFDGGSFNYGSWADIWFIKNNRPVALKFDGTVDYELDHTDFTKKLDGTASDVEDSTYAGNFMSEMPTVYVKRWEDSRYNYIAFSDKQVNSDFLAQAHTNANGTVNDAVYLPMFKGWKDSNNKLRSLMGTYPTGNTTGTNEVTYASNCGAGWQLWDKAKIDLIMDLIVLITKSTNCRANIGNGDCQTYDASDTTNYGKMKSGYETDGTTRSANSQFYGSEGTDVTNYGKHHMIAFYIEDLWGNRWDRCLGFNLVDNVYKVKMTPPYVLDSDSTYQSLSVTPPSSEGWLKNVSSGVYGDVPTEVGASSASGFANYFYKNASGNRLSLFGGAAYYGLKVGRFWSLRNVSGDGSWIIGGSPCYTAL